MEKIKETVVEEKVMNAGMSLADEFAIWFKENRDRIRHESLRRDNGNEDTFFQFTHFLTDFCLNEFYEMKGIKKIEVDEAFVDLITAEDFFNA